MSQHQEFKSPMALISIKETCARTTLSRTSIWKKLKFGGDFPRPVELHDGTGIRKAFVEKEVDDWIGQRIAARDSRDGE